MREYFLDSPTRVIQSVLGAIWCLDAGLQFQSFMYSHGFVAQLRAGAAGQPGWAHASILWGANLAARDLTLWNTLFAVVQLVIGIGLLLRPAVRPALVLSCAWALVVWWFGEGFAGLLMSDAASPFSGAPGAVIYVLAAGLAWPGQEPGGVLGRRGARVMWAALWLVMAWLWLEPASAAPGAVRSMIDAAPSGMSWLSSLQDGAASLARGNGVGISLVLAGASALIGVGVGLGWRVRQLLGLAVALNVVFWLLGQGLGGIFQGGATDPNVAPLFILLAYGLWRLEAPHDTATALSTLDPLSP